MTAMMPDDWRAWDMADGNVMVGQSIAVFSDSRVLMRRVDGGQCTVAWERTRAATCDDFEVACDFFILKPKVKHEQVNAG